MNRTSGIQLAVIISLVALVMNIGTASASLSYYYVDTANVDPGAYRNHTHTLTFSGSLNVTIPSGFNISSYTGSPNITGNITDGYNLNWNLNLSTVSFVTNYTNGICTSGTTFSENIYDNNVLVGHFRLLCATDDEIVNLKFENGHGESAWLDEPYFTYPFVVYTLIRVYEHSNYYDSEVGKNVAINCTVPNVMFTSGKFSSSCSSSTCNISKTWEELDTQLFRVFVFSQKTNYSIGSSYHVNCSDVTWNFTHEGIRATLGNYQLESRTVEPINFSVDKIGSYTLRFNIKNNEKYTIHDVFLSFNISGAITTKELSQLVPSETKTFEFTTYESSVVNVDATFIPSWEARSWSPIKYEQTYIYSNIIAAPSGGHGGGGGTGFECTPALVSATTDESSFTITCKNNDLNDYKVNVTLTGDLSNLTSVVWDNQQYAFLLKGGYMKYVKLYMSYPNVNKSYSGQVIFTSDNITQLTVFNLTSFVGVQLTDIQRFAQSVSNLEFTSATFLIGERLGTSCIDLPRGGYIPTWIILLIVLSIVFGLYLWKKTSVRNHKRGIIIYILLAFILLMISMMVLFVC